MLLAFSVSSGRTAETGVVVVASSASVSTLGSLAFCSVVCDSVAGDVVNILAETSVGVIVESLVIGDSVLSPFNSLLLMLVCSVEQVVVFPKALPVFLLPKL